MICSCFTMFFEGQQALICGDLQGANQLQISANQRAEKCLKRRFANHVICGDLRLICGLQITLLRGSCGRLAAATLVAATSSCKKAAAGRHAGRQVGKQVAAGSRT